MNSINGLNNVAPLTHQPSAQQIANGRASEPRDIMVLPGRASSAAEARQKMQQAREMLSDLGAEVGHELRASSGLTASLSDDQQSELKKAGFQLIEDQKVALVPRRPRPSAPLQPGWLLESGALEVVSQNLERPEIPTAPALQPEAQQFTVLGLPGAKEGLGSNTIPTQVTKTLPQPEGPSAFTGPLPTTGKGVGIAIIDSGIYPHPDLADRLVTFMSATGTPGHPVDELGHGTHVAGDAAGSGATSNGRLRGPAPEANLIGIQVLDGTETEQRISEAIDHVTAGLDWMVANKERYNIRVANLSLGLPLSPHAPRNPLDDFSAEVLFDPIGAAINRAVASGIAVVAAAGNSGSQSGTINETPAINPNVITVGALDTHGTPDRGDDTVADFSSRGPTPEGQIKPDILAPGVDIMAPNSPGSAIAVENARKVEIQEAIRSASDRALRQLAAALVQQGMAPPELLELPASQIRRLLLEGMRPHQTVGQLGGDAAYIAMDGTSMASPIVAGVVAAMVEANPALTPAEIKEILKSTADPLPGVPATDQGAGVLDAREAVEVAARRRQPS